MDTPNAFRDAENPAVAARMGTITDQLVRSLPDDVSDREHAILERALRYAAEAEQRLADQMRRIETLENLSTTDPLTGLLNRRGFEHHLNLALARARRYGETGLIAIGDLDGFKTVNDSFGHSVGDRLLCCAADTLSGAIRETDILARLGGDEFALLLVNANWRDGQKRVRTLQWLLDSAGIVHRGTDIPLRVSIGTEPYGPENSAEDLIHRADMAMYYNKRAKTDRLARTAAE